jgi:hypothetical protein
MLTSQKTIVTTWKVIHLSLSSNKIIVMLFLLIFSCTTCLFPPSLCLSTLWALPYKFFYQLKSLPYTPFFQPRASIFHTFFQLRILYYIVKNSEGFFLCIWKPPPLCTIDRRFVHQFLITFPPITCKNLPPFE